MSALEPPIGHQELIAGLWRAQERGRLPHALLFEGPAGIGKFRAARWFVQGLYCETRANSESAGPCGRCGPCKRIASESSPDLFVLDPLREELEIIPIARVAEREGGADSLCGFFRLRAMEGGLRTVIVREFERANEAAQNALLKTLEEPGEGALLILESSRPDLLLETIRSRCITLRFERLSDGDCERVLQPLGPIDPCLVRWSRGSPGRALAFARQAAPLLRAILEQVLRGKLDPFAATRGLQESPGEFEGKTPTAQLRARTRAVLELLLAILADGTRQAAGLPCEELAHGDLARLASGSSLAWTGALERVLELRGELELNLNPEGLLDRALLCLPVPNTAREQRHA